MKAGQVVRVMAVSAASILAACGGGGGGSAGPAVSGAVVKGPVLGATVCAYAVTNGAKGAQVAMTAALGASGTISNGCYVTGADGGYSFTLPSGTAGDILIEATGGSFCDNEAQIANNACAGGGAIVNLGATVMSSVVALGSSGTTTIYTTPLTTAAVSAAAASGFTSAAFNTQFNTLAGQIIGAGTSITPATQPTPANQAYLTQVATFLKNGGTLTSAVNTLKQGSTSFSSSSASGNTAATVNAALAGSYNLEFHVGGGIGCGNACSYTDGQAVSVTVGSDGTLTLPGNKVLNNPFYRSYGGTPHTAEVIWLDSAGNVEYALSNNTTGVFNEINVGDPARPQSAGIPGFVGQLRSASVTTTTTTTTSTAVSTTTTSSATGTTLVSITPISGAELYTMLYASTQIGLDIRPVTATFASDNTLTGYYAAANEGLQIGTMTNAETSGTSVIQIGRWHSGQFGGNYYSAVTATSNITLSANQGFHYVLAYPPQALPCSGSISYALAAATKPTRNDGSIAPGTLDSLAITVTFNGTDPQTYQTAGSMTLDGSAYTFSGSPSVTAGPRKAFGLSGLTASGGVGNPSGYGVFAGTNAQELGVVLAGLAPGGAGASSVRVAARLVQTASTAVACN